MVGFVTEDGEKYFVNAKQRQITGGVFKNLEDVVLYEGMLCLVGMPAVVIRNGGERVELPKVVKYLTMKDV